MSAEQRATLAAQRAAETDPEQREAYALAARAGFDWYDTESSARRMAEHAAGEIVAQRNSRDSLIAALNEAYELLQIARSALYKLGLDGRGSDALPHETRMFALHFSPAQEIKYPYGTTVTGSGRLAAFWKMGNDAIVAAKAQP